MSGLNVLVRKLESVGELSDAERSALRSLPHKEARFHAGQDVACDGDRPSHCCILIAGFMHRYKTLADGRRQILAFHTPGDAPDLQSLFLRRMDHSLAATVPSTGALVPHAALRDLLRRFPGIAELLWRDTLIDAAIFRAWMVGLGQQLAQAHMAHMLCEIFTRLGAVGLTEGQSCELPLTQGVIGEALGLSTVHVNRTLQQMRADGLIEFRSGRLTILDWDRLARAAEFDPDYLHLREPARATP